MAERCRRVRRWRKRRVIRDLAVSYGDRLLGQLEGLVGPVRQGRRREAVSIGTSRRTDERNASLAMAVPLAGARVGREPVFRSYPSEAGTGSGPVGDVTWGRRG